MALVPERERAVLRGETDVSETEHEMVVERVRSRIAVLEEEMDALEAHGGLAEEVRAVVCED
jgi:hypothetical protein